MTSRMIKVIPKFEFHPNPYHIFDCFLIIQRGTQDTNALRIVSRLRTLSTWSNGEGSASTSRSHTASEPRVHAMCRAVLFS